MSLERQQGIIDGINKIILEVVDDAAKEYANDAFAKVISDEETLKKMMDMLKNKLSDKVSTELDRKVTDYINSNNIASRLTDTVINKLKDYGSGTVPLVKIVKLNDTEIGRSGKEYFHKSFDSILSCVSLDDPVMLVGPAGSGKNVAVSQVAKVLGLELYYTNNVSNEFKLTGFIDAGGRYQETEFYKAFKNGGLFFLDEIDASDPSSLVVINSALANDYMAFPNATIDKNPKFKFICAANTFGKGGNLEYIGRNILDAATLDRFDTIYFDYDRDLERALYPNDDVLNFMWTFREAADNLNIHHIVSTRSIGKVYKKYINKIPCEEILLSNVIKDLGEDDLEMMIGKMRELHSYIEYNDFYKKIRTLKLGR